jgi:hypothetical protein
MVRALLLVMLLQGLPAWAEVLTPARLTDGEYSIEQLVRLPKDLQPGHYEIHCQAAVRRQGRAQSLICYHPDKSLRHLVGAVAVAGRRARFVPATYDGATVDAFMLLMVRIDERGKILESQVTDASNASQILLEAIRKDVQRMYFLPGYFDGKPVPMSYVEPVLE